MPELSHDVSTALREAAAFRQTGRSSEAESVYRRILAAQPDQSTANYQLGLLLQESGRHAEALECLKIAADAEPGQPWQRASVAVSLKALGRLEEAIAAYENVILIDPGIAAAHNNLGNLYKSTMRHDDAVRCFRKAIELDPRDSKAMQNLGGALVELGQIEESIEAFRHAIRISPDYARAHHHLAFAKKHEELDSEIEDMKRLHARGDLSPHDRVHLGFGLGKALDDLGRYSEAFRYYAEANRIKQDIDSEPLEPWLNEMVAMRSVFSEFELPTQAPMSGPTPIFVIGMPRSGTSLTESILSKHSLVHGVGELPTISNLVYRAVEDYPFDLQKLSRDRWRELGREYVDLVKRKFGESECVVDKMPFNFIYIGAINRMFPHAKIIHCVRDPRDTCLSCFKAYFLDPRLAWTGDLEESGIYYRNYLQLMDHWHEVLPDLILDSRYESLVTDPETAIIRILEYCELPLDERCLRFSGSTREVSTASAVQVREPIHGRSLQSWKNYEKHLGPLLTTLRGN